MQTMSHELSHKLKHPVPALFEHFGISRVSTSDAFTIRYKDGMLEISVVRASGTTETCLKTVKGRGFAEMTSFEPMHMTRDERDLLIKKLYKKGATQVSLEKKFGISQAMISRIVRRIK